MSKYRCPECGFRIFNRRVPRCESCGAALPEELLLSAEERAALDAEYKKRRVEQARKVKRRGNSGVDDGMPLLGGMSDAGGNE